MFGCPAYFINHNMFIGAFQKEIFVRLSPGEVQEILEKYAEIKPFTPRAGVTMTEYVAVPETLCTKKENLFRVAEEIYRGMCDPYLPRGHAKSIKTIIKIISDQIKKGRSVPALSLQR